MRFARGGRAGEVAVLPPPPPPLPPPPPPPLQLMLRPPPLPLLLLLLLLPPLAHAASWMRRLGRRASRPISRRQISISA